MGDRGVGRGSGRGPGRGRIGGCFRQGLSGICNIREQKRGVFWGVGGEKSEVFLIEK